MRQAVCHFVIIIIIIISEALAREARAAENHGLENSVNYASKKFSF